MTDEYVEIDFTNLSVNDFLEKVTEINAKEIIIDQEIEGEINFLDTTSVLKSELIPLANAILESKHLTLVNKGNYYIVVKSSSVTYCTAEDIFPEERVPMTVVYLLDDLDGKMVQVKMKPLLPKSVKVIYDEGENSLSITTYAPTLRSIKMLIDKMKEREN